MIPLLQKLLGQLQQRQHILDVVFDVVSDPVDYQMKQLLSQASGNSEYYYRVQVSLPKENYDMDNASNDNLLELRRIALDKIHERHDDIQALRNVLMN